MSCVGACAKQSFQFCRVLVTRTVTTEKHLPELDRQNVSLSFSDKKSVNLKLLPSFCSVVIQLFYVQFR